MIHKPLAISGPLRLVALTLTILSACAVTPEDPGQCALVCGKSIITGNDVSFHINLKTPIVTTECPVGGAGAPVGPLRTAFLIGEDILDQTGASAGVRPVPNISIDPLLIGDRPKLNNENDADTRYQGLLTLKANWCSDACGVVLLDTIASCPGAGGDSSLTVQVHSGALFGDPAVFPISTKDNLTLTQ